MKKYMPLYAIVISIILGCSAQPKKNEIWKNDKIDANTRAEINKLNNEVYACISENNFETLSNLLSDSLLAGIDRSFTGKFMSAMQRVMKGKKYTLFDEFHIKNIKPVDTVTLTSGTGDSAWTMKVLTTANESYVSLLVAGDTINEVMLKLVYSKVKGVWKVNGITGEDYRLKRKNAILLYNEIKEMKDRGDLMDAITLSSLGSHCLIPGGKTFKYSKEKEIKNYYDSLTAQGNKRYAFPYVVNELNTRPQVVNIHYELIDGTFAPMVVYQSTINVADTNALRRENDEFQLKIGSIFKGMDKNNRFIIYRAYNQLPDGQNNPPYYGYIQKNG